MNGKDNSCKNVVLSYGLSPSPFTILGNETCQPGHNVYVPHSLVPVWRLKQRLFAACLLSLTMFSDEKCLASVLEPSIKFFKLEQLMLLACALSAPFNCDTSSFTELSIQYM